MKSIFTGHGYVMNDNRASGGLLFEDDLLGCKHCQGLIDKSKWRQQGAFCHACDSPLCSYCDQRQPQFGCEVFEKQISQAIENSYRKEQNAKVLGI